MLPPFFFQGEPAIANSVSLERALFLKREKKMDLFLGFTVPQRLFEKKLLNKAGFERHFRPKKLRRSGHTQKKLRRSIQNGKVCFSCFRGVKKACFFVFFCTFFAHFGTHPGI